MQGIFQSAAAIFLGAVLASFPAMASNWAHLEQREIGGMVDRSEWDTDSLVIDQYASQSVSVTWRRYATTQLSPVPETQENFISRVDCQRFGSSMLLRERVLVRRDGSPGMRLGPPVESSGSDAPRNWATWGSTDGKLIRAVCEAAFPGWVPEFLIAHEKECEGKVAGMCSPDKRELAYSVSLLLYRKHQALEACGPDEDAQSRAAFSDLADRAVDDVLAEVTRCGDGTCQLNALNWMLFEIGSDLERTRQGLQCKAFEQRAESIATALHSACLGVFNRAAELLVTRPDSRQMLASEFRPKLVEIVLQHRAAMRARKKPPARPDTARRIQS